MHPEKVPLVSRFVVAGAVLVTLTGATVTDVRPPTAPGALYAIGDSWAAGLYADPAHAFLQDAADDLGTTVAVDGESGSGYLTAPPGTSTYPDRAARLPPDRHAGLVIVQGGSNDDAADLGALPAAVARTVSAMRQARPEATVVLLGPGPDPWPVTGVQRQVDRIIAAEASRLGVRYISPLSEGWFTGANVGDIIDPATQHPTAAGDEVLGARLAADLRGLGHRSHRGGTAWLTSAAPRAARARIRRAR